MFFTIEIIISSFLVVCFLVLTGVYAGAETGMVTLTQEQLRNLAKFPQNSFERTLFNLVRTPERFLSLTLIGINMSIVVATSLSTKILEQAGTFWLSFGTTILSLIIFLFCEVLPKIAFASNPLNLTLKVLPIIKLTDKFLSLPITITSALTKRVMQICGLTTDRNKRKISRDELLILLSIGAKTGVIRDKPHKMAKGIIALKEMRLDELMVHRTKIEALDVNSPPEKAVAKIIETGYSRLPVFEGSIDQIIGMVYFKDLLLKPKLVSNLREIMKPVEIVPENKNAFQLFREMLKKRFQAAVIIDEYGSTTGFVTLEDLIEKVVGEIHDELDEVTPGIKIHNDGSLTIKGDLSLASLEQQTNIAFSHTHDVTTVNGAIVSKLGRIPSAGECLLIDNFKIEILQADQKKILLIRLYPSELKKT